MMELVQQLVSSTGVSEQQAEGGAGLIMGLLKDQLASGDFSQLADAVPEANGLIDSAPSGGGMGGLLGGVAGALGGGELGNLAKLAGGFSDLGLDSGMIGSSRTRAARGWVLSSPTCCRATDLEVAWTQAKQQRR